MVGRHPPLIASTYEVARESSIGPVSGTPESVFGRALEKTRERSDSTPPRKPALSALSAGSDLSEEGGSEVPSVGCGSGMHVRRVKRRTIAARVAFCSRTAGESPAAGRRDCSRYSSAEIGAPSGEVSSSWKSRSSQTNSGKNSESDAAAAAPLSAEPARPAARPAAARPPSACTRILWVSWATRESWSMAALLIALVEL